MISVNKIDDLWEICLSNGKKFFSKILINATGPMIGSSLKDVFKKEASNTIRLIQGSHIIIDKLYDEDKAYILQQPDKRIVFIIPYLYFLIRKRFSKKLIFQTTILLFMGATQGFLGWWMVKSGLVDNPDVSHIRLATHLTTAFLTFSYTFWIALSLVFPKKKFSNKTLYKISFALIFIVLIQIIYGAFVAGLDAGKVYNTWPKMHDEWIAESVYAMTPFWNNFINGLAGVQFIHRTFAYLVFGLIVYLFIKSKKFDLNKICLLYTSDASDE